MREGYAAALDETRSLRDESRRVVAACKPAMPKKPACGPQNPSQQRARLLRRGHHPAWRPADGAAAQCHVHPSTDIRRPSALHLDRTRRTGSQDRQRGRSGARPGAGDFRSACASVIADSTAIKGAPKRWPARRRQRVGALAAERNFVRPVVDDSLAFVIRGGRHPVVEQALSRDGAPSSPTTATCRRPARRKPAEFG